MTKADINGTPAAIPTPRNHNQVVTEQFGSTAAAYLTSSVHAEGADLQDIADYAKKFHAAVALDVGCGGGHVSFALAPHVAKVIAYDLSDEMLCVVDGAAKERGLTNLEVQQGSADQLPFADATFDLVCTRYSAHHWKNLPQALKEMARVLKPGGKCIVIDTASPEDILADTYLQSIELLRDASHVRNRSLTAWHALATNAGLTMVSDKGWKLPLQFDSWIARMRTPSDRVVAIKSLWDSAPTEVRDYFALESDYSFAIDSVMIVIEK
ncbi:class I SAM-dependent methyltransferase [Glaciimonas immobilis]|uniref:SAM-dependent methyltransferase n=1 Tax=Glaciimonas immobilis TaxID=728004 RepID=A0A840RVW7_9BURK|nr:class I SAM-dependent methyltransferase [Glaciimonas immobilis]KAF3996427.1 class I SAM-dependent methyltransferase [Glaciimonas immobilis]MBB5201238.1 SAM-dependent methyltransferase [Glaciimonas immobilis]